jgi:hypothetical protein
MCDITEEKKRAGRRGRRGRGGDDEPAEEG